MIISTFKSIHKAYVDLRLDMPWEEIKDLLLTHNPANNKHDVELYNMVEFKTVDDPTVEWGRKYHYVNGVKQETYDEIPNTVRRCKNNVVAINGIVLDVDEKMSMEQVIDTLDGIEYVLYTTFRHTKEKHKFRVVIPFSRPLLAEDVASRQQDIIETFPGVDNASFTVSQSFYFHSGKNDNIAYHNKGIIIDPYSFKVNVPKTYNYTPITDENVKGMDQNEFLQYRQAVIDSLLSCSNLHYAGTGDNNLGVLTLVSICKSIGLSFSEYDNICQKICANDSELKKPHVRHNAWVSWTGDRVRRETRDSFIKSYNGKPVKIITPISEFYDFKKLMEQKYGNTN